MNHQTNIKWVQVWVQRNCPSKDKCPQHLKKDLDEQQRRRVEEQTPLGHL